MPDIKGILGSKKEDKLRQTSDIVNSTENTNLNPIVISADESDRESRGFSCISSGE